MKIHVPLFILFPVALALLAGFKKSPLRTSEQVFTDSVQTVTFRAKFIRKSINEHCGFVHILERNLFEIISFTREGMIKSLIEVEYSTECVGTHFTTGRTYFINASKHSGSPFYRNIKTTPNKPAFL